MTNARLLILLSGLLACAAAPAAALSLEGDAYVLRGDPGPDTISVEGDEDGLLEFTNPGPVMPAGCAPGMWDLNAHCTPRAVLVDGGDGADRLSISLGTPAVPITILGGGDDDTITGHDGPSTLDGGPGNDTVTGGGGADVVRGGDGDDELSGDGFTSPAPDVIDGGPGTDRAGIGSWANAGGGVGTPPIAVSLDGAANDGRPGEQDNVVGLEQISYSSGDAALVAGAEPVNFEIPSNAGTVRATLVGSPHADRLKAAHGSDTIDGGAGDDQLEGGYGDDTITGGPGRDRILADASGGCDFFVCNAPVGNDTVLARDGEADSIDCGVGTDRAVVDPIDTVANCETVDAGGTAGGPGPGAPGGTTKGRTCKVPKVTRGTKLSTARTRLKRAGCATKTKKVRSRKVRKGRVVRLSRARGAKVKAGAKVTIYVSRGRK